MSFLETMFRSTSQSEGVAFFNPVEDLLGMSPAAQEKQARHGAMAREAAAFWKDHMTKLADQHVVAVQKTLDTAFDLDQAALNQAIKENDDKLKTAQRLLLQQSDARWSKSITNSALESLHHSWCGFRIDAGE